MNKTCLGCGNDFEGKLSICSDCFDNIENVRSQFDSFPRGFRKKPYLFTRKLLLGIAFLNVLLVIVLVALSSQLMPLIVTKTRYNLFFLVTIVNLPILFIFLFSFYLGDFFHKQGTNQLVKTWSDKEWYSEPVSSWVYVRYWLPAVLPFFVLLLVMWFVCNRLMGVLYFAGTESIFIMCFYIGLGLGLHGFSAGFLAGFATNYYFSTNWMPKLSK